MTQQQHDTIRETIISRADKLALTAYAIWKLVHAEFPESKLNLSTVGRYMRGDVSTSSQNISQICAVLGLELVPRKKARKKDEKWN